MECGQPKLGMIMRFLIALFLLIALPSFGAVPAYTSFRGTGGILITSNPPTGNITIDGSGIFTTSGTNATVAISTNGVLVMVAATNVNFITGSNVFLAATNIGSTAHLGINAFTPVPFINGAVSNYLLTYVLPIIVVDQLTVSNLFAAPPLSSVQYNSNGITRGSAGFIYTNGQVRVADIVVAGQGVEITAGSLVLNGGATALAAWTDLGNIRWPSSGVVRFEDQFSLNMNRIQLGGDTAAFPAIGRTNGDVIILGANGNFKLGGSTNRLIVPAVHIANDGGVGTPLLSLDNPLSAIRWDLAIDSNPQTYFLGLGRVGDATPTMVWEIGGNVGINTTNPATTLDVNGRTFLRSNVWMSAIPSNATPVAFLATDSGGEVYETAVPAVSASAETNAVLTNIIGTVAGNVTNVVSLSTSNATSKPLTNSYADGVVTVFGLEAGANVTITPNGSNLVIAASASGGGGAGSLAVNDNQFVTNALLNFKAGALTTNLFITSATNATRSLTVNTNVLVVEGGNVGIGTASPAAKLEVSGSGLFGANNRTLIGQNTTGDSFIQMTNGSAFLDILNNARQSVMRISETTGNVGMGTTASTNRLDVNGHTSLRSNLFLPNLTSNSSPIAFIATDSDGRVYETAVPSGEITVSGHSNAIPFINGAGNAFRYIDTGGGFGSLTNPGYGFNPISSGGPQAGYGGLMVFANESMGLVTIGHPNPGSDFATFTTALVISNRYNSAADFKNDMIKFDAVMVGTGLRYDSTMTRWRVWQGTGATNNTSSNDVAEINLNGRMSLYGGTLYPSNSIVFVPPTAAELGIGGYWVGRSNASLVTIYSLDGSATAMKVLAP